MGTGRGDDLRPIPVVPFFQPIERAGGSAKPATMIESVGEGPDMTNRFAFLIGVAACFTAAPALCEDVLAPDYPETYRADTAETQFGVVVADPYRWLENDVRSDRQVADWVEAQNAVTDEVLAQLPLRDQFKTRITQLTDYERFGLPEEHGGRYFYTRNDGLQNQSVLYVRDGLTGTPRVLIDPNEWSDDDATALGGWSVTDDGSKLLYAIQDGGSDWRTLRVLDVGSGEVQPDTVEWVKFSGLSWAKDGSGFYYSRFPVTAEGRRSRRSIPIRKCIFTSWGRYRPMTGSSSPPPINRS